MARLRLQLMSFLLRRRLLDTNVRRRCLIVPVLTLVGILIGGCGHSEGPDRIGQGNGPLYVSQQPTTACASTDRGTPATFAVTQFDNTEAATARIISTSADNVENATIEGFLLVPNNGDLEHSAGIGAVPGFPPRALPEGLTQDWSNAVDADGSTVPAGHLSDLVVGVSLGPKQADAVVRDVSISYSINDTQYRITVPTTFVIPTSGKC